MGKKISDFNVSRAAKELLEANKETDKKLAELKEIVTKIKNKD